MWTIATVSDPQAVATVLGIRGVEFMLENGRKSPLKFYFGAPSSAPLGPKEVRALLEKPEIKYLGEVLDFRGVIKDDPEILAKIQIAKELKKHVDGHAPGVFGEDLKKYCAAGIETDHECESLSEARGKRAVGMKILVREGSIAKNFNTLFPLLQEDPEHCMLCSDHLYPDSLLLGHINLLVRRAIQKGMDPIAAICCSSKNPVEHYGLEVGLLRVGDPADFIIVDDLISFRVRETYIDGECVFKDSVFLPHIPVLPVNRFETTLKNTKDFAVSSKESGLLKMAVVDRYHDTRPIVSFIKNFGLKKGAIASSRADNIIAIGATDEDLRKAVNAIIEHKGGLALSCNGITNTLPLPIAGLMSTLTGEEVARRYSDLDQAAKAFGVTVQNPFSYSPLT